MSTHATIDFAAGGTVYARVYRHHDGYPDGLGVDLKAWVEETQPPLSDPPHAAALWVAHDITVNDNFVALMPPTQSAEAAAEWMYTVSPDGIAWRNTHDDTVGVL